MGKSQSKQSRYQKIGEDRDLEPIGGNAPPAYEDANPSREKMQIGLLIHLAIKAAETEVSALNDDWLLIIGMLKQLLKSECQIRKDSLTTEGWKHVGHLLIFLMKREVSSHVAEKLRKWLDIKADEMVFMMFESQVPQKKVRTPKKKPAVWSVKFWIGEETPKF